MNWNPQFRLARSFPSSLFLSSAEGVSLPTRDPILSLSLQPLMSLTLEVRWFGTGPVPQDLQDWFGELGATSPSAWTDLYLPSEDPAMNLKLRSDNFQVKKRLAGPTRYSFGPHVTGRLEQWAKWSFPVEDASLSLPEHDASDLWVPVKKTRHQFAFTDDEQKIFSEGLPLSPPATIEIECTEVVAKEENAWTICLETEGPPQALLETLTTVGPVLFTEDFPVGLSEEESFGYAQWLQQLSSDDDWVPSEVLIPSLAEGALEGNK